MHPTWLTTEQPYYLQYNTTNNQFKPKPQYISNLDLTGIDNLSKQPLNSNKVMYNAHKPIPSLTTF